MGQNVLLGGPKGRHASEKEGAKSPRSRKEGGKGRMQEKPQGYRSTGNAGNTRARPPGSGGKTKRRYHYVVGRGRGGPRKRKWKRVGGATHIYIPPEQLTNTTVQTPRTNYTTSGGRGKKPDKKRKSTGDLRQSTVGGSEKVGTQRKGGDTVPIMDQCI